MKKLVVLLAGLSLMGGVALGEEATKFNFDFGGTELKFNHDLYNSAEGNYHTRSGDNKVKLNLNLKKDNTKVSFGTEFNTGDDAGDALAVTVNHKIFDRLEAQVKGELNFGADSNAFKAVEKDAAFVKYTPENYTNVELGFYPYDLGFTIGDKHETKYKNNSGDDLKVPGIRYSYKITDKATFKLALGTTKKVELAKKEDIHHIKAEYDYAGEKLGVNAGFVTNTEDKKNAIAKYEFAANIKTTYSASERLSITTEIGTAKLLESGNNGTGYFLGFDYDTDWSFDSKADSSIYLTLKNQDKNYLDGAAVDGLKTVELGMNFAFDNVTFTPNVVYKKAGLATAYKDVDGKDTDTALTAGLQVKYTK